MEETTLFLTYSILPIQDIHLRSGKVLQKDFPPIIEEQIEEGEQSEISNPRNRIQKSKTIMTQTPPFPERLVDHKPSIYIPEIDIIDELKNSYVKIPLFQAIK